MQLVAGTAMMTCHVCNAAQAAAPKYEQMDALKGKDYGKARTKYDYMSGLGTGWLADLVPAIRL